MKYKFNHKSLSFEREEITIKKRLKKLLTYVLIALSFAVVTIVIYNNFFTSPKEKRLIRELELTSLKIDALDRRVNLLSNVVRGLEEKDDNLYRALLEAEPVKNRNNYIEQLHITYDYSDIQSHSKALRELERKIDILTAHSQAQLSSYKELWELTQKKEAIYASIPAISPVKNPQVVSGFGMRYHPIYKILRRHTGIDIIGRKGTPIYATADGVVSSEEAGAGYGITVIINHGNGYKTLYAHLSKKNVRTGQKVKRGEVIGYMGSSGLSVSSHLHYEVMKNDTKVNPVHYFFADLTPEEYNQILEEASKINQSLS
ncbi:MAG: M23 family metallopeptidase [Bacteroidales bacterium]|jgi:murein DD-endopeptidase MepM/ murein hydrolase activator NlpD|nr:M23 family metallopeptidase [Bacteroidales bacterium]MDD2687442.1 M23 family metallopeptidase [Bacteroidales bacterium]MDD3691779.1 M23 family metallopeptidase [Bacteroidales bacterium]MDD4045112.1 M23 family metallopeptidase [Bacteroidales bacterium]MDD4582126.1 M23 family metallopeptidase [Bacteroidales bacterium]